MTRHCRRHVVAYRDRNNAQNIVRSTACRMRRDSLHDVTSHGGTRLVHHRCRGFGRCYAHTWSMNSEPRSCTDCYTCPYRQCDHNAGPNRSCCRLFNVLISDEPRGAPCRLSCPPPSPVANRLPYNTIPRWPDPVHDWCVDPRPRRNHS